MKLSGEKPQGGRDRGRKNTGRKFLWEKTEKKRPTPLKIPTPESTDFIRFSMSVPLNSNSAKFPKHTKILKKGKDMTY